MASIVFEKTLKTYASDPLMSTGSETNGPPVELRRQQFSVYFVRAVLIQSFLLMPFTILERTERQRFDAEKKKALELMITKITSVYRLVLIIDKY